MTFAGDKMHTTPILLSHSTQGMESTIFGISCSPNVSVIIPTYNRKKLLLEAVRTCLDQTYKDLEIIIVDDGSTDETSQLVRQMLEGDWYGERIIYVQQKNRGASSARNRGLEFARGDYIQFLDSDDLLLPTKIAKQINELESPHNLFAACCYCSGTMGDSMNIDSQKLRIGFRSLLRPSALVSALSSKVVHGLPTPSPLWRRSHLITHAGWREDIALGDDLEYYIRLLSSAEMVCFVDEELFFVREHVGPRLSTGQMSSSSLESLIRTRQSIYSTLAKAGLWDATNQQAFLGAMRTIYANALQLNDHATIRDLEDWLWKLSSKPRRKHQLHALILLRRSLGHRFLLAAYKLLNSLSPT